MNKYSTVLLLLIISVGCRILWAWTNGLQTFTAEGARRLEILDNPVRLPAARLEDANGQIFGLDEYQGSWLLVEFIYTRCPTLCSTLGLTFKRIAAELARSGAEKIRLLSVSFDPDHDTAIALQNYGHAYNADGRSWRLARIDDKEELARLLKTFGIIVIPNQSGGYEHNAAIHLINPDGMLARIYDHNAFEIIVRDLHALSETKPEAANSGALITL